MTEIHVVLMGGNVLCATWTENQTDEKRKEKSKDSIERHPRDRLN
jgi:hypothetical protein